METDEARRVLPFQLQLYKPVASQIKIAEWNPEKDLLAMVTEDSKILLHRFNWQRLWTISPDSVVHLEMENEKMCSIPHSVVAPLVVSSSRGVACVFAARKRVLVYILDEDEDEVSTLKVEDKKCHVIRILSKICTTNYISTRDTRNHIRKTIKIT